MLFTTYDLALEAGADEGCPDFKAIESRVGSWDRFGKDTPVSLDLILEQVGTNIALWCLRATYPEQRSEARRVARTMASNALFLACKRFGVENSLRSKVGQTIDYLEGRIPLSELAESRLSVWQRAWKVPAPERWYYLSAYLALSLRPEKLGPAIYECGMEAVTDGHEKSSDAVKARIAYNDAFIEAFKRCLGESDEVGPGRVEKPSGLGRPRKSAVEKREKRIAKLTGRRFVV